MENLSKEPTSPTKNRSNLEKQSGQVTYACLNTNSSQPYTGDDLGFHSFTSDSLKIEQNMDNRKKDATACQPNSCKSQDHKKFYVREIAGKKWFDSSLAEWPENDYRLFVGNLSKDVTDEILAQHFAHYSSFVKARVIRDKYTKGPKGYGFISFLDVTDFSCAMREMDGTYIINRPCKLIQSTWKERTSMLTQRGYMKKNKNNQAENAEEKMLNNTSHRRKKNRHIEGIPNFV